jgi:hypothetical protein
MAMSNSRLCRRLALGVACLGLAGAVHALRLDLVPGLTNTNVGSSFSVDVVVSELDAGVPPAGVPLAVSDYDLDILFDDTLLDATGVTFFGGLGGPADSIQFSAIPPTSAAGVVDLAEISFLAFSDLRLLQGDSFVLARLGFLAQAEGTSSLQFSSTGSEILDFVTTDDPQVDPVNLLCSEAGCAGVGGARVIVGPAQQVPEPGSLLLLGLAIVSLAGWRRLS